MSSTTTEASDARCRARVYAFLAAVFSTGPTEEAVLAVRAMAEDLGLERPESLTAEQLQREYMELFVVPNPRYVAPYESVFCDPWTPSAEDEAATPAGGARTVRGLLMGKSAESVRRCYEDAGAVAPEPVPDHLATELRFMAWLWDQQGRRDVSAAGPIALVKERFREEHLLRWIPLLRDRVEERDRWGFYAAALRVTEAVLERDR